MQNSDRLILNLKNLNEFVTYQRFKIECLQSAAQMDGSPRSQGCLLLCTNKHPAQKLS